MALLGDAIVDQNCVKVVWSLFLLFVRLLDECLQLDHFGLDVWHLVFSGIFVLVEDFESCLQLFFWDVLALRLLDLTNYLEVIIFL